MNDEQRSELRKQLRGDAPEPVILFSQPGSLTRVYAVAWQGRGRQVQHHRQPGRPRWRARIVRRAA